MKTQLVRRERSNSAAPQVAAVEAGEIEKNRYRQFASYQNGTHNDVCPPVKEKRFKKESPEECSSAPSNSVGKSGLVPILVSGVETELSIENAIELVGFGSFHYIIMITSGLCMASDAIQVTLLSFLTPILAEVWELSDRQTAGLSSTIFAGGILGTLLLGPLADKIGRRPVFLMSALVITISGCVTALAPNYSVLIVAIFLVGTGLGGLSVPFDIVAEFLPLSGRGGNLLIIQYAWTIGVLYVVTMAYFILQAEHPAWRLVTVLCTFPCALSLVVGYYFVPESPHWLAARGRTDEAIDVLRTAATRNGSDRALPDTLALHPEHEPKQATLSDLMHPRWREITLRLWGSWLASSFGYYGTLLVTTRVFYTAKSKNAVVGSFDYNAIFLSSSAELFGTTLAILAVDRIGRIRSLVVSFWSAGILICMLCTMAELNAARSLLVCLSFCARIFEMAGPALIWVLTAEVLPTEIRSTGHSTANAMARAGAFMCPYLVEGKTPLVSVGLVMLLTHTFTVYCVDKIPETSGRGMGLAAEAKGDERELLLSPISSRTKSSELSGGQVNVDL